MQSRKYWHLAQSFLSFYCHKQRLSYSFATVLIFHNSLCLQSPAQRDMVVEYTSASYEQVAALVSRSTHCSMEFEYHCQGSSLKCIPTASIGEREKEAGEKEGTERETCKGGGR